VIVPEVDMVEYLRRLFAYDAWANEEALASVRRVSDPPARAVQLLAHVAATQRLWWGRLHSQPPDVPVWPEWALDETAARLAAIGPAWRDYLGRLTPDGLARQVAYTNTQGESWSNSVEDVLRHVLMHGAYHRGQVATHLRLAGHAAGYTDYIHAVRQGLVE
jgi:uncharacterized damage-inducible protein DinB